MGGHLRLPGQSHLSLTHLGGWTPMGGNLRLPGQPHLSLTPLGGWTLMGGHLRLTVNLICPDTNGRLDPYGGTFEISG